MFRIKFVRLDPENVEFDSIDSNRAVQQQRQHEKSESVESDQKKLPKKLMTRTAVATRACVLPYLKFGFSVPRETEGRVANLHIETASVNGILSIIHRQKH